MTARQLIDQPVHLGLGATAEVESAFRSSPDWYADYARRHSRDGAEGRLVTLHKFRESWGVWEMHPHGTELVVCIAGQITLYQRHADSTEAAVRLGPGDYAINAPGVWHTADVAEEAMVLFITAGAGTEHRPR
jgi:quercetin dioxygenase-like cupin family protein